MIGSALGLISPSLGYIVCAGCIGLLNNLTFVIIMEVYPKNKDFYTILVLAAWAFS